MHDEVLEWQRRLERTFGERGVIGGSRILQLRQREDEYPTHIHSNYYGHTVLADSFVAFFIETLELTHPHTVGTNANAELGVFLLQQIANFKTLRAAQNAFFHGYPLAGFSLLRDLKDQSLFIAAVALGHTTFRAIKGFEGIQGNEEGPDFLDRIRRQRMADERRVLRLMIRGGSGLPPQTLADLQRWEALFNYEVHGSGLTSTTTMTQWMAGASEFPVYPAPNQSADIMLINRFEEVSWMLLRTFPVLQLQSGMLGAQWEDKWHVLDRPFQLAISRGTHGLVEAVTTLVEQKFPFNPTNTHFRPDQLGGL